MNCPSCGEHRLSGECSDCQTFRCARGHWVSWDVGCASEDGDDDLCNARPTGVTNAKPRASRARRSLLQGSVGSSTARSALVGDGPWTVVARHLCEPPRWWSSSLLEQRHDIRTGARPPGGLSETVDSRRAALGRVWPGCHLRGQRQPERLSSRFGRGFHRRGRRGNSWATAGHPSPLGGAGHRQCRRIAPNEGFLSQDVLKNWSMGCSRSDRPGFARRGDPQPTRARQLVGHCQSSIAPEAESLGQLACILFTPAAVEIRSGDTGVVE